MGPTDSCRIRELFPEKLPTGVAPSRHTDHRIDFPEKFRITAPRLYRLAPSEDKELFKQLDDMKSHGYITDVTSPYGSGILFVPKAKGKLRIVVDYIRFVYFPNTSNAQRSEPSAALLRTRSCLSDCAMPLRHFRRSWTIFSRTCDRSRELTYIHTTIDFLFPTIGPHTSGDRAHG